MPTPLARTALALTLAALLAACGSASPDETPAGIRETAAPVAPPGAAVPMEPAEEESPYPAYREEASVPADQAFWREVRRWSGNGSLTTQKIRIPSDEWRMIVAVTGVEGASPFINVAAVRDGMYLGSVSRGGVGTDTTYVHGRGTFHVEVVAAYVRWTLVVQAPSRLPAEVPGQVQAEAPVPP